jgi:hypothetical protein
MDDDCNHLGPKFRVSDLDSTTVGLETVSCASCIADEIETFSVGTVARWEIERLPDD